jgi:hypothetical protein
MPKIIYVERKFSADSQALIVALRDEHRRLLAEVAEKWDELTEGL